MQATGLRARHKADRTGRILEAATRLFRSAGYEAVRLEEIAVAADVSVGTVYNYFETKGDILLAIVTMEVEEVLANGTRIVRDPGRGVGPALDALVGSYFDHSLVYLSKAMWRRAMALAIEAPGTPFSQRYTALDGRLTDQVCALIEIFQRAGQIRPDLPARTAGEIIFNNLNMMFIEFVKSEEVSPDRLKSDVGRQNSLILQALAAQAR